MFRIQFLDSLLSPDLCLFIKIIILLDLVRYIQGHFLVLSENIFFFNTLLNLYRLTPPLISANILL